MTVMLTKKIIEKRVIILMKEANLSVLLVTTGILLRGDQEEVVEKNAEFDNSEILKKLSKSQYPINYFSSTDPISCVTWKKLMRRMQCLKIVNILMKEVNRSV